ncbi:hypothetical protein DL96DRAFT_1696572 [Flagelloscypha sp. PMI_526]|nr:hypothetical protein DL96DRAFT_1696572 [Flagelloscypha sp. PMI_526]
MKRKAEEVIEDDSDVEMHNLASLGTALIEAIFEGQQESALIDLIAASPLWYQEEVEGMSCLHAAAYMQNPGLIRLLIEKGATWNATDKFGNTAGDIALSFNDTECYTIIRDAGLRQELLLNLLSSRSKQERVEGVLNLQAKDTTEIGDTEKYLKSKLRFKTDEHGQEICTVQSGTREVGVMMGWERDIMEKTVARLTEGHPASRNFKILNIGFGLGIIDSMFESLSPPPSLHVIVEAHPDVLANMRSKGWYDRPQSATTSRFSFFNGLGATNSLFHDVYTRVAELHLADIGLDIQWSDVEVKDDPNMDKWGGTQKYFSVPLYRLPVASLRGT